MPRLVCLLLFLFLLACGRAQDARSQEFDKARLLIEKNCATCPNLSKEELEEGIRLATRLHDAGYRDRPVVLRLLADAYGTLGAVVLKLDDPRRGEALRDNDEFLRQLMEALPADANVRYEYTHRFIGKTESMLQSIDERIAQYRRVLALDPKHEKAQFDLAQDLFRKGEDDESLQLLRSLRNSSDPGRAKLAADRLASFEAQRARSTQVVRPVQFSGEVSRGQNFDYEFGELVFRLTAMNDPITPGWEVRITPRDSSATDYSSVVTGPYHGLNPRYLFVGYGRSAKDVVDAKGTSFRFVVDRAGYERADAAVKIVLGHTHTEGDYQTAFDQATREMDLVPFCVGSLRLIDSRLTPEGQEKVQAIDWLKFEVELCGKERY